MNQTVLISLLVAGTGALATIASAIITAYATLHKDRPPRAPATESPEAPPAALPTTNPAPASPVASAPAVPHTASAPDAHVQGISRTYWRLVVVTVSLVAVVLVAGYGLGQYTKRRQLERILDVQGPARSYAALVNRALEGNKKYFFPGVTYLVTLEQSADGKSLISDRRIIYDLIALSDIASNENAFVEGYHSAYGVERIPGSDPEEVLDLHPAMQSWNLLFDLKKGERRQILTGARSVMPIRLNSARTVHAFQGLGPTEDAFCLPNNDGDAIEEVLIVVQSGSLPLYLPSGGREDAILAKASETRALPVRLSESEQPRKITSVVSRFRNIGKGEVACLRVGWGH